MPVGVQCARKYGKQTTLTQDPMQMPEDMTGIGRKFVYEFLQEMGGFAPIVARDCSVAIRPSITSFRLVLVVLA